jgi:NTE family protein
MGSNFYSAMMVWMQTALVLSAGGLFGAWQVGAWKTLAPRFRPDLVVGASIGSLNGWAIAGGCAPEELARYWLDFGSSARLRPRLPRSPLGGWLDGRLMEQTVRALHAAFRPLVRYALVVTDLMRLRPHIFQGEEVTAEHLLASCAVPLLFDQRHIGGRIYSDGGLLNVLPEWAAVELGGRRLLALNALPEMPSAVIRAGGRALRRIAPGSRAAAPPPDLEVLRIVPSQPLGPARDMMIWDRERVRRWIQLGERDAAEAVGKIKTFTLEMF